MINADDLKAFFLTLKLSFISTVLLILISTPLAWWLSSHKKNIFRSIVSSFVSLPLVLPPTVIGFYLLILLGPRGPLVNYLGLPSLVFSFAGLLVGSLIYSLPFVLLPLQSAFESIDKNYSSMASTLRAKPWDYFLSIVLPLSQPSYVRAFIMGFAHTLGEFGIVLMIGGNIPESTRVISISLFEYVQETEYAKANHLALFLLALSFLLIFPLNHFKLFKGK